MIEPAVPAVLAVLIDRLPAWILPPYGASWVSMPVICGLAARGVVFERLIATGDGPRGTLADLLAAGAAGRGLLEAAEAGGCPVALVTDDPALATAEAWNPLGARAGVTVRHVAAAVTADVEQDAERTNVARLFAAAGEIVAAGRHRLVVVHVTSLGLAWDAPDEFRDAYVDPEDPPPPAGAHVPDFAVTPETDPDLIVGSRQVFAGQLTLLDRCLGGLLDAVPAPPAAAATHGGWTVLVAGLRGFGLGLHGRVGGGGLPPYAELTHLPAVLVDAAGRMAAQRYGGLLTPRDLGATLVGLLGGAPPAVDAARPWDGASLEPLLAAWQASPRDRVITIGAEGCAVTTPAWRLVAAAGASAAGGRPPRLFAMPDDFFELCDVADRCPDVASELGRLLAAAGAGRIDRCWTEPLTVEAVRGLA